VGGDERGLPPGLYEQLVTLGLADRLAALDPRLVERSKLDRAEAPDRIALHLSRQIHRALESVPETERVSVGLAVVRDVLDRLGAHAGNADLSDERLDPSAQVLRSVTTPLPDGSPRAIDAPLIPLLDTTLLTNAPSEPRVGHQLASELASAESVDVVMAFVRSSGIRPLLPALRDLKDRGGQIRVLTTTYTGSTERRALDQLAAAGAEVRVSYDLTTTRLHAKAWTFHRPAGYSTSYIGSSNLTHSAMVTGLEWNVRVSGARNPDVIAKVQAVFDSYWEGADFVPYDPAEFDERTARAGADGPVVTLSPLAVSPLPFQARLLEQLQVARRRGHHRNLLVAATGTGKTVMAALDYANLRRELPRARLLFVAHRSEILDQSQATFRHVLRDPTFGEQWIAGRRPTRFEHVFASVQSLRLADLDLLEPEHFDVVVVDEFHHAAASSYTRLLDHVRPVELLGLTATPERADGESILHWFDHRIAAELRLWDAIDQHYLTPFAYYGVHDGLDLTEVPWRRGTGYDVDALTNLYTGSDRWAEQVVTEFVDRVDDLSAVRALGFCVGIDHARFMARVFNRAGIPSVAVWGATPEDERAAALRDLDDGRIRVVFSVDLFNEGVDLPNVDTLLLLRPTESPTLFLQQLGRGLRRAPGKAVCTVLDFVGQHRREFRFDRRLGALLGGTRKDLERQVAARFPYLPAGCHMELDHKASEIVLRSIREAIPSRWPQKVEELRTLVAAGHDPDLRTYLEHTGLEVEDVYDGGRTWSDLCEAAGVAVLGAGPAERELRRAVGRLLHVDDEVRLDGYRELLAMDRPPDEDDLDERDRRGVRMLLAQLVDKVDRAQLAAGAGLQDALDLLWQHPQVRADAVGLFGALGDRVDHVHHRLEDRPDVPLLVHARYTRLEVLAAYGHRAADGARVAAWQSGVIWLESERADLFAFTLDKTGDHFSPTTRYRDYAISRELIHWESQAGTRADSPTGRRYQHHLRDGSDVMLFARLAPDDRAFWFLGPAAYVRHEGERPMAITWRLRFPLPGDLFARFAAAVA
jgi:superfamily II DNA or RNA helicase/HKD family nuclease